MASWKVTILNRRCIFKVSIFHCYVSLLECICYCNHDIFPGQPKLSKYSVCCSYDIFYHWYTIRTAWNILPPTSQDKKTSWWLNQPNLKNMLVKMGSSSPMFGVKNKKMFELPPARKLQCPPWKPTWPLKIHPWKRRFLLETMNFWVLGVPCDFHPWVPRRHVPYSASSPTPVFAAHIIPHLRRLWVLRSSELRPTRLKLLHPHRRPPNGGGRFVFHGLKKSRWIERVFRIGGKH